MGANQEIKFSILIPVFNKENTLKRCIDSIYAQKYDNFEVIMVNDGSSDKSSEICKHYAACDDRIKVVEKENDGLYLARIDGMKNAHGDYYIFLDADDYLQDELLEDMKCIIKANTDVEILIFNKCRIFERTGERVYDDSYFSEGIVPYEDIMGKYFDTEDINNVACKCVKRIDLEAINRMEIIHKLNMAEDALITGYFFSIYTKIYYTNKPYYMYCISDESMTSSFSPKQLKDSTDSRSAIVRIFAQHEIKDKMMGMYEKYVLNSAKYIANYTTATLKSDKFRELFKLIKEEDIWSESYNNRKQMKLLCRILFELMNKGHYILLRLILKPYFSMKR